MHILKYVVIRVHNSADCWILHTTLLNLTCCSTHCRPRNTYNSNIYYHVLSIVSYSVQYWPKLVYKNSKILKYDSAPITNRQ